MTKITEEQVKKTYKNYAPVYDFLFGKILEPGRIRLCEEISLIKPRKLLEIGVGTGLTLNNYPLKTAITGIDLSEEMLQHARKRAKRLTDREIILHKMDAEELQFESAAFDCVAVPYVLSVTPSPQKLISEIRRVCKPDGDIYILNHFSGGNFWWALEKIAQPIAARIGFRSEFSFSENIENQDWKILSIESVNIFGLSRLVHLKNA